MFVDITNDRLGVNTATPSCALDVIGNIRAANIIANADIFSNVITANTLTIVDTANIAGINITGNTISSDADILQFGAAANISVSTGNLSTSGTITSSVTITGGNLSAGSGFISTTGNVQAGNLRTGGLVSAAGTITGGNVSAGSGFISTTGNVNAGNVNTTDIYGTTVTVTSNGNISLDGTQINIGNLTVVDTTISTSLTDGNITLEATGIGLVQIAGSGGIVIPYGNTAARPTSPVEGTLRYNNVSGIVEIYTGTFWKNAAEGVSVITNQTINGDGINDTFTLDQESAAASILVTINGINQTPGVDYDVTSGTQITFTTTPIVSDLIQVRFIASVSTITSITNASGNTSVSASTSGNINFEINNSTVAQFTNTSILNISNSHSLQLPTYTVAQANGLSNVAAGQIIYVSNGATGLPCLAVYSGGGWKQVAIGSSITT